VEIEPDMFTGYLDRLLEVSEFQVCPGAGGYDAACVVSKNSIDKIKELI